MGLRRRRSNSVVQGIHILRSLRNPRSKIEGRLLLHAYINCLMWSLFSVITYIHIGKFPPDLVECTPSLRLDTHIVFSSSNPHQQSLQAQNLRKLG